jgi:nucleotide-binding universal stress UspA family protein
MSKILLAVSDRWVPDARVDAIGNFVQRLGGSLLAVHVAYGTEASGAGVQPGERVLEQIAQQLRNANVKVETLFLFSDNIGAAVVKTAEEHHATIIMLGLSEKGMLTRLIEGNIAQEVIRSTRIPVLLLPPDWQSTM